MPENEGVQFRLRDGKRSSTAAAKRILAAAATPLSPGLAGGIQAEKDWRKNYLVHLRDLIAAGIHSEESAGRMADDGLAATHEELVFVRGGEETSLQDALVPSGESFSTEAVKGEGPGRASLQLPYRDGRLEGDALLAQLERWEENNLIEPSVTEAIRLAVASPEWFDLSDVTFVQLGAASEMGPFQSLMDWGAHVIAVDLPRPQLWKQIIELARRGRGRVSIPVRTDGHQPLEERAGVDLLTETPRVANWLRSFDGSKVLGNYVYADGGTFVRLAAASDALFSALCTEERHSLAYLATPTDVYAVPHEIVVAARGRARSGVLGVAGGTARTLTGGRLFAPNYDRSYNDGQGQAWGISDCLVPQQGPNYALAKHIQRWRALRARRDGHVTSATLAPATRTKSVLKNRVLAAAYAGAPRFGVEVFASSTSSVLMAALLVHDLRNPKAAANPAMPLSHPYELFVQGAAHGGLLRLGYEPRSILPLAVLLGMTKTS